jgi:hypothetical protein
MRYLRADLGDGEWSPCGAAVQAGGTDIARHPEDWHGLQKVFAADLDAARLPALRSAATDNTAVNGPENTPANAPP